MNLRLTEKSLDRVALPAGKAQLIVWDDEVPGFGVVVGRRLATFIANYRANGAKRRQVAAEGHARTSRAASPARRSATVIPIESVRRRRRRRSASP